MQVILLPLHLLLILTVGIQTPFDDEGYAESRYCLSSFQQGNQSEGATSTSSFVTSIASEIRKGTVENGRVYAVYGNHGKT
jgi:hypothetical protein